MIAIHATIRFLSASPSYCGIIEKPPADAVVLLTNGRGGMARLAVDVGGVNSKYDCALGANLNSEFPVDRHIFVKRLRVWISADGFITALNLQNLVSIQPGPPAVWNFVAEAGDGRTVELKMSADMIDGSNTTVFTFARLPGTRAADLPPQFDVRLTVRVDIEDRNFHSETHRNGGAEFHFQSNTQPTLEGQTGIGFAFTPASDRQHARHGKRRAFIGPSRNGCQEFRTVGRTKSGRRLAIWRRLQSRAVSSTLFRWSRILPHHSF